MSDLHVESPARAASRSPSPGLAPTSLEAIPARSNQEFGRHLKLAARGPRGADRPRPGDSDDSPRETDKTPRGIETANRSARREDPTAPVADASEEALSPSTEEERTRETVTAAEQGRQNGVLAEVRAAQNAPATADSKSDTDAVSLSEGTENVPLLPGIPAESGQYPATANQSPKELLGSEPVDAVPIGAQDTLADESSPNETSGAAAKNTAQLTDSTEALAPVAAAELPLATDDKSGATNETEDVIPRDDGAPVDSGAAALASLPAIQTAAASVDGTANSRPKREGSATDGLEASASAGGASASVSEAAGLSSAVAEGGGSGFPQARTRSTTEDEQAADSVKEKEGLPPEASPEAPATERLPRPGDPATDSARPGPLGSNARLAEAAVDTSSGSGAGTVEVDRVRFVQRVARAFHAVGDQGGELRLRLSPPELGALQLQVTVRDGVLTARMETESTAVRNLLLDSLPALRERLAEQEIKVARFEVDVREQPKGNSGESHWGGENAGQPGGSRPRYRREAPITAAVPPGRATVRDSQGQINIVI